MISKWAKNQPKEGDVILVCGHIRGGYPRLDAVWLKFDPPLGFKNEARGVTGTAQWFAQCPECFTSRAYDLSSVKDYGVFSGAGPVRRAIPEA
jgi:hypothetical protein